MSYGNEQHSKAKKKPSSITPKAQTVQKNDRRPYATWQGYVNYTPTESDKSKIKEVMGNGEHVLELWAKAALDGYTIQQKDDPRNGAFVAELYAGWGDMPNAGYKLTARGSDCWSALQRVLYIHFYAFEENWGGTDHKAGYTDEWG